MLVLGIVKIVLILMVIKLWWDFSTKCQGDANAFKALEIWMKQDLSTHNDLWKAILNMENTCKKN